MIRSTAWPADARAVDVGRLTDTAGRPGAAPADRLAVARAVASTTPPLSAGTAGRAFVTLAAVAAVDVALARTVEPHLDALGILAQAGIDVPDGSSWGVFAAEGPGTRLTATPGSDGSVVLDGTKPWCSLASTLSHALVTAHRGDDRQLFAVDLRQDGVTTHDDAWVARGMPDVPSGPVDFDGVRAAPVGDPGWYLTRPGFAWGGIGVAACWWGGAVGLARVLRDHAAARPDAELLRVALGAVVADLADAEDALADAAARIDADSGASADDVDWALLAQVVRSRVRRAVDGVRTRVIGALGPAPLTSDAAVAARVADLELYVLQDHGDRDLARIGRMVLERGGVAW
ncbi:acyl-CoA dehydrogenase family protein [Curtobacterium sp. ZW137]|uniref:acyl-CoA dehydrogenase family protein n=1 Tax=Curtobacterium sp. ZW137 TaxID=2485104 RepID=UPI000F4C20D0|nr:acyl-CoA dehydrogenase family protein [Curtobacterium sp. ZW137]ROP60710.1 alkylation response protein AidB-like acyl-CoA dehydrogenase [Curtobacterium sp. ZW137]